MYFLYPFLRKNDFHGKSWHTKTQEDLAVLFSIGQCGWNADTEQRAEAQAAVKQRTVLLSVKNGTFTVYDILMQQFFMRQVFQCHWFRKDLGMLNGHLPDFLIFLMISLNKSWFVITSFSFLISFNIICLLLLFHRDIHWYIIWIACFFFVTYNIISYNRYCF